MTASRIIDDALLERRYKGETPSQTLFFLYQQELTKLVFAVIFFIIKHSGAWVMPLITANVIDIVSSPQQHPLSDLWGNILLAVFIFVQNIPSHYLFVWFLSQSSRNIETKLRSALTRRFQQLSITYHNRHETGELQAKIIRDVEIIQQLTTLLFQNLPMAGFTLVFAVGVTAVRVPIFLVFYILTVPIAIVLVRSLQNALRERNRDFRREVEGMTSSVLEMLQLIPVTRAHGVEYVAIERMDRRLNRVRSSGLRLDGINAIFGASAWVVFRLFETLCLTISAYCAYTQIIPITIGDVVLLTSFFSQLTNAILMITTIYPEIAKGLESVRSIGEVLESPDIEANEGKHILAHVIGDFRFDSVSFAYEDAPDEHVLNDIDLHINAGETTAFVGHSGSGKSTLINLVVGFIRPTHGKILLDGVDMDTLDLRSYRRFISVVPQTTILFEGTVRENILYGTENVSEETLQQVLDAANAREFIEHLPQGLDTIIGENGVRLSGGQRQRISIARAFIRNPRVLVLDEATSALDNISEAHIQEALGRLMKGRTTFVVAHRLSTIQSADRIVVLDKGRITEIGHHSELIKAGGVYAQMHAGIRP